MGKGPSSPHCELLHLQEMFPESSGEIGFERFDPAYFLLEHHHNTTFDDLKVTNECQFSSRNRLQRLGWNTCVGQCLVTIRISCPSLRATPTASWTSWIPSDLSNRGDTETEEDMESINSQLNFGLVRYEIDCKEYGRDPTVAVEEAISQCKGEADKMFFDVLGRKDKADKTRNALTVLNRFKFQIEN